MHRLRWSPKKRALMLALLALHLSVLTVGITGLPKATPRALGLAHFAYERVTGAGNSYGFFSPDIGQPLLMRFKVETNEAERLVALEDILSWEAAIRYGNMVRFFVETYPNERLRRSVAASLAARVFARFPKAREITVMASVDRFPSLAEWRAGRRPEEKQVYKVKFRPRGVVYAGH